jgi:murein DD-endopeptidase MepM/ murein hydrolase activator NlpD
MHRNSLIRTTRLAAAIAGVTLATAALSGTAFAADSTPTLSAHQAHVMHVTHDTHEAHLIHLANSTAAHQAHAAHEATGIAAANAAGRATAAAEARSAAAARHATHEAHEIAAANTAAAVRQAAHQAHEIAAANTAARDAAAASRSTERTLVTPATSGYHSPVPAGTVISQVFGVPNSGYAAGYHTGTDFAVSVGTPLYAVGDSTVVSAGYAGAYGNAVALKLADGHYAFYAHMSAFNVSAGQKVSAGDRIGLSGNTGNSTGPHLHFELRTVNTYGAVIDPITYLKGKGVSF